MTMTAKLVFDGGDQVWIPEQLGTPREDQMQGTPAEQLSELAGRACYDSLGKGRPSFTQDVVTGADPHTGEQLLKEVQGYHDHILSVGHGSVLEHFNFTAEIRFPRNESCWIVPLLNRPGLFISPDTVNGIYRLTLNPRVIVDWEKHGPTEIWYKSHETVIYHSLRLVAHEIAPHIIRQTNSSDVLDCRIVEPAYTQEAWITLFLAGSRGFSHELVRHGDFTAISQRSTRYVDESESPWVEHPLITTYRQHVASEMGLPVDRLHNEATDKIERCCGLYNITVTDLQAWLISRGVDKLTARKQARGAARGYLGNALYTEVIFSASVAQWRRMLDLRACAAADAEIRQVFCMALGELQRSRYGDRFADYKLQDSPDGIGQVAVKTGPSP